MWRLLADLTVLVHATYVAFVVFGLVAILAGCIAGWRWVRNFYFRVGHLAAILAVCAEALLRAACPLTTLENLFRQHAGEAGYPGDFVARWLDWLIFYDAPHWVFTAVYLVFGAIVLATLWLVPPQTAWRRRRAIALAD